MFTSGSHDGPTRAPRSRLLSELRDAIAEASTPHDRDDVLGYYAEELAGPGADAETVHAAEVARRYDAVYLTLPTAGR